MSPRQTGRITVAARRYWVWGPILAMGVTGFGCFVRWTVRDEFENQRKNRAGSSPWQKLREQERAEYQRRLEALEREVKELDNRLDSAERGAPLR